jgi:serine protease AprX
MSAFAMRAIRMWPGNQPLTYVLSFMNGHGGTSSPGHARRSQEHLQRRLHQGADRLSGAQILDIDDVSSNYRARARSRRPHHSAHGRAGLRRGLGELPGAAMTLKCGTSDGVAARVSGAVALFIENYRNEHGVYVTDPSPRAGQGGIPARGVRPGRATRTPTAARARPSVRQQAGLGPSGCPGRARCAQPTCVRYFDKPMVLLNNTGEEWTVQTISAGRSQSSR